MKDIWHECVKVMRNPRKKYEKVRVTQETYKIKNIEVCEQAHANEEMFNTLKHTVPISIDPVQCKMLVDSGSSVNIVNTVVDKKMEIRGMRFKPVDNHFIYPYASEPINIQGLYSGTKRCNDRSVQAELLLIVGNALPIL